MARAAAVANENDRSQVFFKQGSCKIILKQGDLMDENGVEVIVIPIPDSDQRDRFQTYPLFDAFISTADKALKDKIKTASPKVRSTNTPQFIYAAKQSYILTTIPYYQNGNVALKLLTRVYTNCLDLAMSEKRQTIAFPTIGCGQSAFPKEDAATALHQALIEFQDSRSEQFKEIRIVVYDKNTHEKFINVFMDLDRGKNAKIKLLDMYELRHNVLYLVTASPSIHLSGKCHILNLILDHRQYRVRTIWHPKVIDHQMHNEIGETKMKDSKQCSFVILISNLRIFSKHSFVVHLLERRKRRL